MKNIQPHKNLRFPYIIRRTMLIFIVTAGIISIVSILHYVHAQANGINTNDNALLGDTYNNNNPSHHNFKSKHLWVKKATGLGITEFFLRLMAWLCLKDNSLSGSQMVIVTGPNIDIAIKLIKRMKVLFQEFIIFDTKETVLELNGCLLGTCFPSVPKLLIQHFCLVKTK